METDFRYGISIILEVSGDDAGFIIAQEGLRKSSCIDDTEPKPSSLASLPHVGRALQPSPHPATDF